MKIFRLILNFLCFSYWTLAAVRMTLGMRLGACTGKPCQMLADFLNHVTDLIFIIPALAMLPVITLVFFASWWRTKVFLKVERNLCIGSWLLFAYCFFSIPAF